MKIKLIMLLIILSSCSNSIKFENNKDYRVKIPIVKKEIEGRDYMFIVDSGASMSIIDSTFYNNNPQLFEFKEEVDLIFTGISTKRELTSSLILTKVDNKMTLFVVSDISSMRNNFNEYNYNIIGILGSDYLNKNKLIINYNNKTLR